MILLLRLVDFLQSLWNYSWKSFHARRKWGVRWKDMTRSGRRYSRVYYFESTSASASGYWHLRPEPGWEWDCPNCKSYSIITASMMPDILANWEIAAEHCKQRGLKIPAKPTAAMAGCTNCKFRPGAPE